MSNRSTAPLGAGLATGLVLYQRNKAEVSEPKKMMIPIYWITITHNSKPLLPTLADETQPF